MRIVIDPGHGGTDVGAIAADGASYESVLAREFCLELSRYLQPKHWLLWPPSAGLKPGDTPFRGWQRAAWANDQEDVGLFFSVHLNAVEGHRGKGTEIFTKEKGTPFAEAIIAPAAMDASRNRGIKTAELSVLTKTDMPAILLELAFIDNAEDFAWYKASWKLQAKAVAKALNDYIATIEGRSANERTKVEGKRGSGPKRVPSDDLFR